MARKSSRPTPTPLTNPFLEVSAAPEPQQSDTSTPSSLEQVNQSSKKFSVAVNKMHVKLTTDCYRDTLGSNTLKKRSYLVTRNEDGSLDLTDVEFASQEKLKEVGGTSLCRATSRTGKL